MRKRLLSLALALALCLGLAVPAFATDLKEATDQDILDAFTIYRNGTVDEKAGYYKADTPFLVTNEWDQDEGGDLADTGKDYAVISKDDAFTITHAGSTGVSADGNTDYTVFAMLHIMMPSEQHGDNAYVLPIHGYYWGDQGKFLYDVYEQGDDIAGYTLQVKAGESTTIPVSAILAAAEDNYNTSFEDANGDCIIRLTVYANYRGIYDSDGYLKDDYQNDYWRSGYSFYFRIDEDQKAQIDASGVTTPSTPDTPAVSFSDVPADAYYLDAVSWAVENDITNGTSTTANTFSPDKTCTQLEILTFLYRADRGEGAASGEDMAKAAEWAKEKGIIDDSFDGGAPCTRATAMSYIWQALGSHSAEGSSFTDVPADAAYAAAVSWGVSVGITNGYGDTFRPDTICNRAQIVLLLLRAYVEEARLPV